MSSAHIVKQFRGTTGDLSSYVGPEGQIAVDTTKKTIVVQDGVTPGGFPLNRADQLPTGGVLGIGVSTIHVLFQEQYDAIALPDPETLYVIIPFRVVMTPGTFRFLATTVATF